MNRMKLTVKHAAGLLVLLALGLACASTISNDTGGDMTDPTGSGNTTDTSTFERLSYPSQATGVDRHCWVWAPKNLDTARKYPVLYVLHGIGGTEDEWVNNARPQELLDGLYASGTLVPMVVVFPNGRAAADDSVPSDIFGPEAIAGFSNFTLDLTQDLMPWIEAHYPAGRDREQRGICGLSMGGGQSLNIGLGHPELFAWVGAFSAAPNTDTALFNLADKSLWPKKVWISCGLSDDLIYVSEKAVQTLQDAGVPVTFHTMPGGHDWTVWVDGLGTFAPMAFK